MMANLRIVGDWAGVVALMLLFGCAALFAARLGLADLRSREAAKQVEIIRIATQQGQARPDPKAWDVVRDSLVRASEWHPSNPDFIERLGLVASQRPASGTAVAEFQAEGLDYFRKAAAARPSSPYTWSFIAAAKYRLGQKDAELDAALANAAVLGPWEKDVQFIVVNIGLDMWNELSAGTQAAVRGQFVNAMLRHPQEMTDIAVVRGRLKLVCTWPGKLSQSEMCIQQLAKGSE